MRILIISIATIFNITSILLLISSFTSNPLNSTFHQTVEPSADSGDPVLLAPEYSRQIAIRQSSIDRPATEVPSVSIQQDQDEEQGKGQGQGQGQVDISTPYPSKQKILSNESNEQFPLAVPTRIALARPEPPQFATVVDIASNSDNKTSSKVPQDSSNFEERQNDTNRVDGDKELGILLSTIGGEVFLPGKNELKQEDAKQIRKLVGFIKRVIPGYRVLVEGHTDNIPIKNPGEGKIQTNLQLSLLRAQAVSSVLIREGVAPKYITAKGFGETQPIDSNATADGRQKNRRVEIRLVPIHDN